MKKKKLSLEVELPVVPNTKNRIAVRMNVEGMMQTIKRFMPDKNKQDLLDEYAKFYIMKQLGVKEYPLKK